MMRALVSGSPTYSEVLLIDAVHRIDERRRVPRAHSVRVAKIKDRLSL